MTNVLALLTPKSVTLRKVVTQIVRSAILDWPFYPQNYGCQEEQKQFRNISMLYHILLRSWYVICTYLHHKLASVLQQVSISRWHIYFNPLIFVFVCTLAMSQRHVKASFFDRCRQRSFIRVWLDSVFTGFSIHIDAVHYSLSLEAVRINIVRYSVLISGVRNNWPVT